jgi:hypothetical protein
MRISRRRRNPFTWFQPGQRRDEYLAQHLLREVARGRSLDEVLNDPYIRNRSTPEQRLRLLDRPDVVAAIGEGAVGDLQRAIAVGPVAGDPSG